MPPGDPILMVMLTQAECSLCDHAKEVLDRVGRDYPLEVRVVDLDGEEGRALADRGGVMFPPGVFVDGRPFSYGRLSERKLRRELDRLVPSRR